MNRMNDSKASGAIRRNSPVNASEQFNKFSEEFLKERIKNRQNIQNRMKNLNTKLYSSQSDLIRGYNPEDSNPEGTRIEQKAPRSPGRKYVAEEQKETKVMTEDAATELVKQLKQTYQKEISALKRIHEMKLKAVDQVVNGKDKVIKELEIENGVLKAQLSRLEGCLKSGRLF